MMNEFAIYGGLLMLAIGLPAIHYSSLFGVLATLGIIIYVNGKMGIF